MDVEETSYGSDATLYAGSKPEHWDSGVIPYNTLPAGDWNWMWNYVTTALRAGRDDIASIVSELVTLGTNAGIEDLENTDLTTIVETYVQRLATTDTPGAILASTEESYVNVDDEGKAYVSGLQEMLDSVNSTDVTSFTESLSALQTQVLSLEEQVPSLLETATSVSEEVETLSTSVEEVSSTISTINETVTSLSETVSTLSSSLETDEVTLDTAIESLTAIRTTIESIKSTSAPDFYEFSPDTDSSIIIDLDALTLSITVDDTTSVVDLSSYVATEDSQLAAAGLPEEAYDCSNIFPCPTNGVVTTQWLCVSLIGNDWSTLSISGTDTTTTGLILQLHNSTSGAMRSFTSQTEPRIQMNAWYHSLILWAPDSTPYHMYVYRNTSTQIDGLILSLNTTFVGNFTFEVFLKTGTSLVRPTTQYLCHFIEPTESTDLSLNYSTYAFVDACISVSVWDPSTYTLYFVGFTLGDTDLGVYDGPSDFHLLRSTFYFNTYWATSSTYKRYFMFGPSAPGTGYYLWQRIQSTQCSYFGTSSSTAASTTGNVYNGFFELGEPNTEYTETQVHEFTLGEVEIRTTLFGFYFISADGLDADSLGEDAAELTHYIKFNTFSSLLTLGIVSSTSTITSNIWGPRLYCGIYGISLTIEGSYLELTLFNGTSSTYSSSIYSVYGDVSVTVLSSPLSFLLRTGYSTYSSYTVTVEDDAEVFGSVTRVNITGASPLGVNGSATGFKLSDVLPDAPIPIFIPKGALIAGTVFNKTLQKYIYNVGYGGLMPGAGT